MSEGLIPIVLRSLMVSGTATVLAATWSLPIAVKIGTTHFRGKKIVRDFFNAMIGIPTVALGLVLYLLLSREGALGFLNLLYTPSAIMLGQALLITPLMISFLMHAIEEVNPLIKETALTLGASEREANRVVLREAKKGSVLATVAGFNRAISELGIALMVGGNLAGTTRVMTTEISRVVSGGDIELAIQLTIVLLSIAFTSTLILNRLRGSE